MARNSDGIGVSRRANFCSSDSEKPKISAAPKAPIGFQAPKIIAARPMKPRPPVMSLVEAADRAQGEPGAGEAADHAAVDHGQVAHLGDADAEAVGGAAGSRRPTACAGPSGCGTGSRWRLPPGRTCAYTMIVWLKNIGPMIGMFDEHRDRDRREDRRVVPLRAGRRAPATSGTTSGPSTRMLMTTPMMIWSTRKLTTSTARSRPAGRRSGSRRGGPTQPPSSEPITTPVKAPPSSMPSMPMLTTPDRSHRMPLRAPSAIGVQRATVATSMLVEGELLAGRRPHHHGDDEHAEGRCRGSASTCAGSRARTARAAEEAEEQREETTANGATGTTSGSSWIDSSGSSARRSRRPRRSAGRARPPRRRSTSMTSR